MLIVMCREGGVAHEAAQVGDGRPLGGAEGPVVVPVGVAVRPPACGSRCRRGSGPGGGGSPAGRRWAGALSPAVSAGEWTGGAGRRAGRAAAGAAARWGTCPGGRSGNYRSTREGDGVEARPFEEGPDGLRLRRH